MEPINDAQERIVWRGSDGTEYTHAEFSRLFSDVHNSSDWKAPVLATIAARKFELYAAVVEFYTATELEVVDRTVIDGVEMMVVRADGYRAGPAGP